MEVVKKSPLDFEKGHKFTCGLCGCEYKATFKEGHLRGSLESGLKFLARCPQCDANHEIEVPSAEDGEK